MRKNTGAVALITATVLYGLYGTYSRMIGVGFGVFTQAWVRDCIAAIISLTIVVLGRKWKNVQPADWKWIAVWIGVDTLSSVGIFVAFNKLEIGLAYFIFYVGIVVAGYVLGTLMWSEKLTRVKLMSLAASVLGLGLLYSFGIHVADIGWFLLAFLSGCGIGSWNLIAKKFSSHYDGSEIVFLNSLLGFFLSVCIAMVRGEGMPHVAISVQWLGILLYALSQQCTVWLVVYGFKHIGAQQGTLIMPLEAVWGAVFGFLFFDESLSFSVVMGEYWF